MTEDEKVGSHHQLNGHELAAGDVLQEMVKDRKPGMLYSMGSQSDRAE